MSPIRVVHKRPGFPAEAVTIPNTLDALNGLLDGGSLCGIRLDAEIHGYVDDEGLLKELPPNFWLRGEVIVGPAIFSRADHEGEEIGLTEEEAMDVIALFNS